jgi:hypothetical protein
MKKWDFKADQVFLESGELAYVSRLTYRDAQKNIWKHVGMTSQTDFRKMDWKTLLNRFIRPAKTAIKASIK